MVCKEVPLRLKVPADAGAKFKVVTAATDIVPLIEWPGVAVMFILTIPDVILSVSIDTALPPVIDDVPVPANSTFAYVLPEKEGEKLLPSTLNKLPV